MSEILRAFPWLRALRPYRVAFEPVLAGLLALGALFSIPVDGLWGLGTLLAAATALALSRIQTWVSFGCLVVAGAIYVLAGTMFVMGWGVLLSALTIGLIAAARHPVQRWVALGFAIVGSILVTSSWGVVPFMAFVVGAWAIGTAAGEALARLRAVSTAEHLEERLDASELELAMTAERERVAQEVHDVVAHSLAVILAQAEGARALSTKRPAAMTDALDRIAVAARSALLDVRGIVDGLTGGDEPPQPTLDDLPELLRGVEEAGIAVRSTSAGVPQELGLAQQTAVFRIVQEGATNAIRHRGRGSALDIVLDWRRPGLSIQVVSSGAGEAEPAPGAGRGIPGMTERARVAGGWLVAGADESGDHRITAFVPFREAPAPAETATEPVPA